MHNTFAMSKESLATKKCLGHVIDLSLCGHAISEETWILLESEKQSSLTETTIQAASGCSSCSRGYTLRVAESEWLGRGNPQTI